MYLSIRHTLEYIRLLALRRRRSGWGPIPVLFTSATMFWLLILYSTSSSQWHPPVYVDYQNEAMKAPASTPGYWERGCPLDPLSDTEFMTKAVSHLMDISTAMDRRINGTGVLGDHLQNYLNPCWWEKLPSEEETYTSSRIKALPGNYLHGMRETFSRRRARDEPWRLRCLPYFFLGGVCRAGTTDFFKNLVRHPYIVSPPVKQPAFWAFLKPSKHQRLVDDFEGYVDHFDPAAEEIRTSVLRNGVHQKVAVDADCNTFYGIKLWEQQPWNRQAKTPCLLLPHFIKFLIPEAKMVFMLRNPVTWLESCYSYFRDTIGVVTSEDVHADLVQGIQWFRACTQRNREARTCAYSSNTNVCHVKNALYFIFAQDWLSIMGRRQVRFVPAEQYYNDRIGVLNTTYAFLNMPMLIYSERDKRHMIENHPENQQIDKLVPIHMLQKTKTLIREFVGPWNTELSQLLRNKAFLWN